MRKNRKGFALPAFKTLVTGGHRAALGEAEGDSVFSQALFLLDAGN